ncbi:Pentatricopeptide repeat superfamily protein [Perilla frutescens var. hirtella]|nr:Pentatricopeptide repeat superfamily protein [Perilla frutescens var. frutescens]KAH6800261.1 Pentatricopeptide repeat superfamily protein [Perilla frutescens var. hirtella]
MFSPSCTGSCLFLYQAQPPYIVDAQTSNIPNGKRHSWKTKYCSRISNIDDLNFPVSKVLPFLTKSQSLSTSPAYMDGSNNVILDKTNPSNQQINSTTIGRWVQSCSNVQEVKKMHAVVIRRMKDPVAYVNNNLISIYAEFGEVVAARRVFDSMLDRNVVSWTAMLNGYQRHGLGDEAVMLFLEFINCGFRGNAQTYVCVLNLCGRTYNHELGRQLHASAVKNQVSNYILDCTILHFYARCDDLDSSFEVFDRMQNRDLVAWTTMITACSQHRRGHEALALLSQMLSEGLDPNEFTICSVLNVCGEEKELRFGEQLHAIIIKKAYDVDVYVGTALVDLYAKCGIIEKSRTIFDRMKRKNAITWNSMIAGYARNNLGDGAIGLFRMMKRLRVSSNNSTMVSILKACGLLRALSPGKEAHAQIFKNFEPSNIFVGSTLVWLYCKCGDYASASKVLQNLPDKDVVSWTAMISGCARLGHEQEALEYLKEMLGEGVEPNPFTYSSALKACAKLESVREGKLIHSSINKTPSLSNVFVGSALVQMYSKCGLLSDAAQVFDSMPERNLVSWKAMIVAYAKNGRCGEALKLMYRMQAECIEVDDYILSTVLTACGDFKWEGKPSSEHCLQT